MKEIHPKIYFRYTIDLYIKSKTIMLLEENIRRISVYL